MSKGALFTDYSLCSAGFEEFFQVIQRDAQFFKQKTAYEMPVRDWSSDVCSSDLEVYTRVFALDMAATLAVPFTGDGRDEIGRASCRERV